MNEQYSDKHIEAFARQFKVAKPSSELKQVILNMAKQQNASISISTERRTLVHYIAGLAATWLAVLAIHAAGLLLNPSPATYITVQTVQASLVNPTQELALSDISPMAFCMVEICSDRSVSHINQLNTWLNQGVSP